MFERRRDGAEVAEEGRDGEEVATRAACDASPCEEEEEGDAEGDGDRDA